MNKSQNTWWLTNIDQSSWSNSLCIHLYIASLFGCWKKAVLLASVHCFFAPSQALYAQWLKCEMLPFTVARLRRMFAGFPVRPLCKWWFVHSARHLFPSIFSCQKPKTSLRLNAERLKWTELYCFPAAHVFRAVFWLVFRQFFWLGFIASFAFPDYYIQWLSEVRSSIQRRDRIGIQPISLLGI